MSRSDRTDSRATSVLAVVRESSGNWWGEGTEFERRKRLQEETLNAITAFSADDRLSREQEHRGGELR